VSPCKFIRSQAMNAGAIRLSWFAAQWSPSRVRQTSASENCLKMFVSSAEM
jgi:hypothetical protein